MTTENTENDSVLRSRYPLPTIEECNRCLRGNLSGSSLTRWQELQHQAIAAANLYALTVCWFCGEPVKPNLTHCPKCQYDYDPRKWEAIASRLYRGEGCLTTTQDDSVLQEQRDTRTMAATGKAGEPLRKRKKKKPMKWD